MPCWTQDQGKDGAALALGMVLFGEGEDTHAQAPGKRRQ